MIRGSNFNPRTPCGVRRGGADRDRALRKISIHAPHAGCDAYPSTRCIPSSNFNPRTPCGVRRARYHKALRLPYFNPRTPCGVRPGRRRKWSTITEFQSTHPMRGATSIAIVPACCSIFQSTHPMRGATPNEQRQKLRKRDFNPRTPCGVRLC